MLLPSALGSSPYLPVSVCGTGPTAAIAAFLGSVKSEASVLSSLPITAQNCQGGFAYPDSLTAWTRSTNGALFLSFCVPTSLKRILVVQEFQPVVHRLRLSSSA